MVMGCVFIKRLTTWSPSTPGIPSLMGEADIEMITVTIIKLTYGVVSICSV